MTQALSAIEMAARIESQFPGSLDQSQDNIIIVRNDFLFKIANFLKNTPGFDFNYLNYITAVDYHDHFEVVYNLISLEHNHSLILKVHCFDRVHPSIPSVTSVWKGADFQEREIYDLMGINFTGHYNLKRIFLWEGFPGYPLRKDFKQQ